MSQGLHRSNPRFYLGECVLKPSETTGYPLTDNQLGYSKDLRMLGCPRSWSKVWEALDLDIHKPGENCGQIVAYWEFQPTAAFHDRENCCNLGSRL